MHSAQQGRATANVPTTEPRVDPQPVEIADAFGAAIRKLETSSVKEHLRNHRIHEEGPDGPALPAAHRIHIDTVKVANTFDKYLFEGMDGRRFPGGSLSLMGLLNVAKRISAGPELPGVQDAISQHLDVIRFLKDEGAKGKGKLELIVLGNELEERTSKLQTTLVTISNSFSVRNPRSYWG